MKKTLYNLATDKYNGLIASVVKVFLLLLSLIYGVIVRVLIWFYSLKPFRLKCKVISVGNITLGGTGKTTVVEYIARYLKEQGCKVAILSRGYRRKVTKSQGHKVTNSQTMGDEPYMLSKKLGDIPVVVDANRALGANKAIKDYGADTVILDDGFQQWKIKKDLEIVAVDSTDPFGNRHLIPRGILREPLSSLKRADLFILTKTNLNPDIADIRDFLNQINPQAAVFEAMHVPVGFYDLNAPQESINVNSLETKNVALFCGIGDPDSFENLIISLGININLSLRFADHHDYSRADLEKISKAVREKKIDTIITTEKDAARICFVPGIAHSARILVLRIKLKIKNEEEFHIRLSGVYSI